ncbi:hypothetical protein MC7420_3179 [Coleofasciculus chthonoplastes PCC 7420]|uniref:Uncharacterized protein n=1 Tax=Coleofasciculus chthonoplastes PCC 7420 TaxID=118168 RepID=B4VKF2_9CYAN|nr:hypothetical protein MC7420_3179 [Coleofasciculus chthonoplastes PCC 7420]
MGLAKPQKKLLSLTLSVTRRNGLKAGRLNTTASLSPHEPVGFRLRSTQPTPHSRHPKPNTLP